MVSKSPSGQLLSIGAFSQASRLSQKALRLYGRQGLLVPAVTDGDNGYRYYRLEQLSRARLILLLRQMDLPLAHIRRLLELSPNEAATQVQTYCQAREAKFKTEKRVVREVIRCLHETGGGKDISMSAEQLTVTTFEAAPQLILSISKRVKIDGLIPHIESSCERMGAFAKMQPDLKVAGEAFGIFHGPVNSEDDGPLEVCLPVQGQATPTGDIVLRALPGGMVATATGTKEQSDFPRVLEIYDAVAGWIQSNGYEIAGSPREGWGECLSVTWPYKSK